MGPVVIKILLRSGVQYILSGAYALVVAAKMKVISTFTHITILNEIQCAVAYAMIIKLDEELGLIADIAGWLIAAVGGA